MAIVLSDLRFVVSVYLVGIVWPLYCLTFDLLLLFSRRYLEAIVLSDLRFVHSVYLVGILWPLYCLTFDL